MICEGDLVTWKYKDVFIVPSSGIVITLVDKSGNHGAWVMWPDIGMRWSPIHQLKLVDEAIS